MIEPTLPDRAETTQPLPSDPASDATGLLAGMALKLAAWRRRREARQFTGFDKHQLRDLGLSPFDQW